MTDKPIMKSKAAAWAAFVVIVILMAITFGLRPVWWTFADMFFAFMMVFCHLMAVYLVKLNIHSSRKLDFMALVFGILTIVALIAEYVAYQIIVP